ncbi:HsdM family class I SAM-dependent methyltransferase [Leptospira licerasiae]|uniref:Eco57I restriction-modification methylase n=1 Tax=Leptospira licerasiae str. MMD4847 TaxID=1049971 RepID=A0ABN0H6V5_9LEPT|nr:N-6 DNA methylase [Leptospira licerasiae]EIE02312.1 Eco57I restriction-modification methylase [Leptospira licerasiae serovar Varillal str. VAR 010]EJZ41323.1 Eco57I restriction-modification methylase [Leptospira licerasiae str. MMD4847]
MIVPCEDTLDSHPEKPNPKAKEKALGQFFTPSALVGPMLEWVSDTKAVLEGKKIKVLDPGMGEGIFFQEFLDRFPELDSEFHGWEIDPILHEKCIQNLERSGLSKNRFHLVLGDFLQNEKKEYYDIILCNPPYLRLSHSKHGKKLIRQFAEDIKEEIPGTANLYVFFLLRILRLLEPGGRASILVPYEFLNAGYGVPIKKAIIQSGYLRRILILDSSWSLFTGAVTSSCILFLENSRTNEEGFLWSRTSSFIKGESIELSEIVWRKIRPDAEAKWTRLLSEDSEPIQNIKNDDKNSPNNNYVTMPEDIRQGWVPIKEFGSFRRGIATGDNGYFLLSEKDASNLSIPRNYLRSSIPKAQYALSPFFTGDDWITLKSQGAKVWLLDAKEVPNNQEGEGINKYLEEGIKRGVPKRFLPSKRKPWHSQENRGPCRILATSFHREEVRFVFNQSPAVHLTCFHGFSAKPEYTHFEEYLFAYLITPHVRKELESRTREYAQGLRKVEPGDLNSLLVPDFRKLKEAEKEKIGKLLHNYRNMIRPWTPGRRQKGEKGIRNPEEEAILKSIETEFLTGL